jgi:hypothetical protein
VLAVVVNGTKLSPLTEVAALVAGVVWVWALVDLLMKPDWAWRQAKRSKVLWVIVTFILGILGALLYVLLVRGRIVEARKARAAPGTFEGAWDAPLDVTGRGGDRGSQKLYQQPAAPPRPFTPASTGPAFTQPSSPFQPVGAPQGPAQSPQAGFGSQGAPPAFQPQASTQPAPQAGPAPQGTSLPPAAWQPDPTGRHQLRYWDGSRWTDHVADNGQQALDPISA